MGFDDRDYARDERGGLPFGRDWSVVTWVIVINLGVYVLQIMTFSRETGENPVTQFLALRSNLFTFELVTHPWQILQLVTYGFAHNPRDILHIVFNLFMFWMFGRELEARFGGATFAKMYLTAIIIAGLVWLLLENLLEPGKLASLIGASGGVSAVMGLFIFLFPKRTLLIWGVIPMPVWAFGLVWIFMDIQGALQRSGNVAFTAHLAGAAYGFLFHKTRWTLGSLWPEASFPRPRRGPPLKVHDPDSQEEHFADQVDEILKKIQDHGQDSLTARERQILEQASRRYQQKHR